MHEEPDRFSLKSVVFVGLYCCGAVLTCVAYLCNAAGESVAEAPGSKTMGGSRRFCVVSTSSLQ